MGDGTVEGVGGRRADRAARRVRRAEHEVIDDQLRAPAEKLSQRPWPLVGAEAVFLLDRHPGQLAPLGRELVGSAALRPAAAKTAVSSHRAATAVIITTPRRRCRGRETRSRAAAGPAGSVPATGTC